MKETTFLGINIFLFSLMALFIFLAIQDQGQVKGYWHYIEGYYPRLSGGYGGAPDGEYTILISFINKSDRVIGSPYCESYGGDLHGYWHYKEGLPVEEGWYRVRLENNTVVVMEAES